MFTHWLHVRDLKGSKAIENKRTESFRMKRYEKTQTVDEHKDRNGEGIVRISIFYKADEMSVRIGITVTASSFKVPENHQNDLFTRINQNAESNIPLSNPNLSRIWFLLTSFCIRPLEFPCCIPCVAIRPCVSPESVTMLLTGDILDDSHILHNVANVTSVKGLYHEVAPWHLHVDRDQNLV